MLRTFLALIFLGTISQLHSQDIAIQFYQGVAKPMVSYKPDGNSLAYKANFGSDIRLGITAGDLNKLSFSLLLGASNVSATHTSNDIISTFTHSSLLVDVPIRYALKESPITSIAVGPSLGLLVASSQTTNGLPVRSESIFTPTNFSMVTELAFAGYSSDNLNIYPYFCYRMMLNSADNDGDNLRLNCLSFGLRMDILR